MSEHIYNGVHVECNPVATLSKWELIIRRNSKVLFEVDNNWKLL